MQSLKPLAELSHWARGNGLEIVLLVTGAMLLTRFATWMRGKITNRIDATAHGTDSLVRSEASKHRHALAQVFTWAALVIIYCATAIAVAARVGIPVTSLVAPAAVAAVALGFGAQRIVQDILAGFFIIAERQYGFGDLIKLTAPNVSQPATGTVEDVTLRVTAVRTADGELVITPNGQITQVTNLSRDWARAVVDVPVPAAMDVDQVSDALKKIGDQAYREPELRRLLARPAGRDGRAEHRCGRVPGQARREDPARQAVRRGPDPAGQGRRRIPERGYSYAARPGNDRPVGEQLMRRIRISTWVLTAVFVGALALYILVKPSSGSAMRHPVAFTVAREVDVNRARHTATRRRPEQQPASVSVGLAFIWLTRSALLSRGPSAGRRQNR